MDILPKKSRSNRSKSPNKRAVASAQKALPTPKLPRSRRSTRRFFIRYGLVALNLLVVGFAGYMVLVHSGSSSTSYGVHSLNAQSGSSPLDALTAADIAVNVAKMTGLPEELAVTNQADVINSYLSATVVERDFVNKAQIMSSAYKSKDDIVKHTVKEGERLGDLTSEYGVTSDSIKWSNDLASDELEAGKVLYIPPVNGLVYVVGVGDTPEKLAETYSAKASEIIAFNDAEVKGLVRGDRIVIPNGVKPRPIVAFRASYGYNGYWYGYCTWYVATKITMPNNWGNANMWDNYASVTPGWTVSSKPVIGAIAQTNAGPEGHVAIVEEVSTDGTLMKYSDMNGIAGWGREGRSDWVPISKFPNYIYRTQ